MSTTPVSRQNIRDFRNCLGNFATGITIITCTDAAQKMQGVTANSFSSVSLDPALVLWSIDKQSDTLEAFLDAKNFAISILSDAQKSLSNHFAQSEESLFDGVPHTLNAYNTPLIDGALAFLECEQYAVHEAGDHFIIIGQVTGFATTAQSPLLFFKGGYRTLSEEDGSVS